MLVYTQSYPLMHFLLSYTVIPTNIMQHVYFLVASLHLAPIKLAYTLLSFDSWIYSKPFGEMVSVTFTRFSSVLLNLPFSLLLNIIFVHFWFTSSFLSNGLSCNWKVSWAEILFEKRKEKNGEKNFIYKSSKYSVNSSFRILSGQEWEPLFFAMNIR